MSNTRKKGVQYMTREQALEYILNEETDESDFSESDDDEEMEANNDDHDLRDTTVIEIEDEEEEERCSATDDEKKERETESNCLEFKWQENIDNEAIVFEKFSAPSGPVHDLQPGSSALDYLRLFFTDSICENIIQNTNNYAEFCQKSRLVKDEKWVPISDISELWCFFGILFIISMVNLPRLSDYWSDNPIFGNAMVKKMMSRNRFMKIKHYFHISDRQNEPKRTDSTYKFSQKLEPLYSHLKLKFQEHFNPAKQLSIDEAMIKFKGRVGIEQYMPMKPTKRGLKIWMLCSSEHGYSINFDLYSGKHDSVIRSGKGLGYDVVMHLISALKFKGHEVYFDRFFTSSHLLYDLYKLGIYGCGTLTLNRKNIPSEMKTLKLKTPHESKALQCVNLPNLICSAWLDKKTIFMLSTNSRSELTKVKRRTGSDTLQVNCPVAFDKYNKHMGGVDLADQRRKYYSVSRKSSKWWVYLFSFLMDTAVNNAFIIDTTTNSPQTKKRKSLYDFKVELITDIERNFLQRKRAIYPVSPSSHKHKRIKIAGRKRTCVNCRTLKRKTISNNNIQSTWECEICKMCLCKSCFDENDFQ